MIKNTKTSYGVISKSFHWLMLILFAIMFGVGWYMVDLGLSETTSDFYIFDRPLNKFDYYLFHKSLGAIIPALAALRLLWRFSNISPSLPENMPNFHKFGAHFVHFLLYAMMLAIPLTGWLMSSALGFPVKVFGQFSLPDLIAKNEELGKTLVNVHEILGIAFLVILAAHVGAALYHHIIKKDDILKRMLPFTNSPPSSSPESLILRGSGENSEITLESQSDSGNDENNKNKKNDE